jgi:hypothetical protein
VRPAWQSKALVNRIRSSPDVDPSSACQRLFNAALHDLRETILIAGLDIAGEAAKQNGLPTVDKAEDIENYPPAELIELAYGIGLLSRPEWRRVHRHYEIRRDPEHEDEAGVEGCVYIFTTCIEVILARDPIHLLRVTDIKALIEQASAVVPSFALLDDYERAPRPRREEICKVSNYHSARQGSVRYCSEEFLYILASHCSFDAESCQADVGNPHSEENRPIHIGSAISKRIKRGGSISLS